MWGGTIPSFRAVNLMTEKKKYKICSGLRWLPINDNTHNNQSKTGGPDGGEYGGKVQQAGGVREA